MKTKILISILVAFTVAVVTLFVVSQTVGGFIETPTFQILSNFMTFGSVISATLFSYLLIRQGDMHKKNNDDVNARAEAFRDLQFIASNHTITEFYDQMLIFRESERYVERLKRNLDFKFYMREKEIDLEDVKANFDNYFFLTVKIPIRVVVGNAVSSIQLKNFRLDRVDKVHNFVPCAKNFRALILYSDDDKRQEVTVNLIANKHSEFYSNDIVNPFTKIKLLVTMHSFLGVAVTGWNELYFTNPQKLEKDGTNKYKINSSQFQISGLPTLVGSVGADISEQV